MRMQMDKSTPNSQSHVNFGLAMTTCPLKLHRWSTRRAIGCIISHPDYRLELPQPRDHNYDHHSTFSSYLTTSSMSLSSAQSSGYWWSSPLLFHFELHFCRSFSRRKQKSGCFVNVFRLPNLDIVTPASFACGGHIHKMVVGLEIVKVLGIIIND